MKKITFKQLKKLMLDDELKFQKELHEDEVGGTDKEEYKEVVKEINEGYSDCNNLDDLVNLQISKGNNEREAFETIIEYLVDLPKKIGG